MILALVSLTGKTLNIRVENIAAMYGLAPLESARLVYETTEEFLTSLEEGNDDA